MNRDDAYQLVSPPATITSTLHEFTLSPEAFDYEHHPAYSELIANYSIKTRAVALAIFIKSFLLILAKRMIRYEMIPLDIRTPNDVTGYLTFLRTVLRNLLRLDRRKEIGLTHGSAGQVYSLFEQNGCAVIRLSDHTYENLSRVSAEHFSNLRIRRQNGKDDAQREFEESRMYARRSTSSELFITIETILRDSGALDAASKYLKREARLIDVNPQINDPSDDFWKRIFPDVQIAHPATAYFHRDASGGDLKFIFYMSDVKEGNGPFGYVLGSHSLQVSRLNDYIGEANDSNGFAGTGTKSRAHFAALPKFLRQKGAFGNDLQDHSRLSHAIVQGHWSIVSPKGSIVMFDTKGIHRGGMVQDGERLVITCVVG